MEGNTAIICESTKSGPTTGIRANNLIFTSYLENKTSEWNVRGRL